MFLTLGTIVSPNHANFPELLNNTDWRMSHRTPKSPPKNAPKGRLGPGPPSRSRQGGHFNDIPGILVVGPIMYVCMHVCIHRWRVCVYTYICVCMYIYIYIYFFFIGVYIYIYI